MVVYFNTAATVSVLYPAQLQFRFNRLKGKFLEFLESVGEGIGRLFANISTQTGIRNRLALVRALEFLVKQVSYSNEVTLEVSSLDIVSFKIFNELFGHPFGDKIIKHVAHLLDDCSPGYAYHVSGDEYYIVHCYHRNTGESWTREFFASREIIPLELWQEYRTSLDALARGIPVYVPFEEEQGAVLGSYSLSNFIANFFTRDSEGKLGKKQYSRTGNDYHKVIRDPEGLVQKLVDQVWEQLLIGSFELGSEGFAAYLRAHNTLGSGLEVVPALTIGTIAYNWENIVPYVSDIIDEADSEAGRNKK